MVPLLVIPPLVIPLSVPLSVPLLVPLSVPLSVLVQLEHLAHILRRRGLVYRQLNRVDLDQMIGHRQPQFPI